MSAAPMPTLGVTPVGETALFYMSSTWMPIPEKIRISVDKAERMANGKTVVVVFRGAQRDSHVLAPWEQDCLRALLLAVKPAVRVPTER